MVDQDSSEKSLPLLGVRVLDLSTRWGMYTCKLFADLGADVIKVEPPGGCEQRSLGPFADDLATDGTPFFWYHNANKRGITLDLDEPADCERLRQLALEADLLVEGYAPGYLAERGLGYGELAEANPGLVVTSISPFGQTGPRKDWVGDDIVAGAMGGLMYLCGMPDSPPSQPGGSAGMVSTMQTDVCAAMGSLMALLARRTTGKGQHVDVSMQEAVAVVNENALGYYAIMNIIRPRIGVGTMAVVGPDAGKVQSSGRSRMFHQSKDGWVCGSPTTAQYSTVRRWLEDEGVSVPDWLTEDWWDSTDRFTRSDRLSEVLNEVYLKVTGEELFHKAQQWHVAIAPVRTPADVHGDIQLKERRFWKDLYHPEIGRDVRYPGPPYQLSDGSWRLASRAPLLGEHNQSVLSSETPWKDPVPHSQRNSSLAQGSQPLQGLTVVDFSWQAAAPMASKYLAAFGARVVKVESATHPDFLRTVFPRPEGNTSINASHIFNNFNAGKLSLSLNLNLAESRVVLHKLLGKADIVLDNYGADPYPRWGITYEQLAQVNPGVIMVRSSLMGRTGPCSDYSGVGYTISALSGINSMMGFPGDPPVGCCIALPDYSSNPFHTIVAILAALWQRATTGRGQYIDLSQVESTIAFVGHALMEDAIPGTNPIADGNRSHCAAPHGTYRCAPDGEDDERWIAIACNTEQQWRSFAGVINPEWLENPRYKDLQNRLKHLDELDRAIGQCCRSWSANNLMGALQALGVPAGVVQNQRDLLERDEHMQARGFYRWLSHPELGLIPHDGVPSILSDTPGAITSSGPLLGEHSEYILSHIAGMTTDEIANLAAVGALT